MKQLGIIVIDIGVANGSSSAHHEEWQTARASTVVTGLLYTDQRMTTRHRIYSEFCDL